MVATEKKSKVSLIEKIEKKIERTGIPLEYYVFNTCSSKGIPRFLDLHYIQNEDTREIDVYAYFEKLPGKPKKGSNLQQTLTAMVIECKKSSEKPWVFFSSDGGRHSGLWPYTKYLSDFDLHFKKEEKYLLLDQIYKHCKVNHYTKNEAPICSSYFEPFTKPKEQSIYKSIDSVLTFLRYLVKHRSEETEILGFKSNFYYPIIVFDGRMFEANATGERIRVKETDYVQLRTNYSDEVFLIDIVRKRHFPKLLDLIEQDHLELIAAINRIRFPKQHVEWMEARSEQYLNMREKQFPLDSHFSKV